jgi:hypothetical protein
MSAILTYFALGIVFIVRLQKDRAVAAGVCKNLAGGAMAARFAGISPGAVAERGGD